MLTVTVCAALSAAGLAVSFLTAYRRRFVAATRLAAVSLLPIGLAMAGLVGLGGKIIQAISSWAADLVFKPTVWVGFAVLGSRSCCIWWLASRSRGPAANRPGVSRLRWSQVDSPPPLLRLPLPLCAQAGRPRRSSPALRTSPISRRS